jgi:hypothetical protein
MNALYAHSRPVPVFDGARRLSNQRGTAMTNRARTLTVVVIGMAVLTSRSGMASETPVSVVVHRTAPADVSAKREGRAGFSNPCPRSNEESPAFEGHPTAVAPVTHISVFPVTGEGGNQHRDVWCGRVTERRTAETSHELDSGHGCLHIEYVRRSSSGAAHKALYERHGATRPIALDSSDHA